ncbi:MAG: phenylacetate--CoA ligase family protein [Candidatus Kerfeldbacteria bacterium]|nr:phenylacetate--CoA ligase family protein [Candidatus Kerfeldbacteria bacterium]
MLNWRKPIIYLFFWKDTHILRYLRELTPIQFWPRNEIKKLQNEKLQMLLQHAYDHVPYYHDLFEKLGIVADGKVDASQFSKIPPLTKDVIREQKERLYADDKETRDFYKNTSGGSTGVPVEFVQDSTYRDMSWANKIMYNRMVGKDDGMREVKLWGSERDIFQGSESFRARLQHFLYNRMLLNSFRMSESKMGEYVERINTFKPVLLWSYIDSAYELARYIKTHNLKVHAPKAILVTAGTVYPEIKEYISKAFNAPVYNQYGSREAGDMACECPERNGLHVFEYLYVFEILDEKLQSVAPGVIGDIYVTLLMNSSMPLIRYRIGDTASWKEDAACGCGRNLPRINDVHGRITDHFRRADGTVIHGEYFTHLFYFRPWIKKFQVIQNDHTHVTCLIVKNSQENHADVGDIADKIKLVMGNECEVTFQYVDDIAPSGSGKYLYTKSLIAA